MPVNTPRTPDPFASTVAFGNGLPETLTGEPVSLVQEGGIEAVQAAGAALSRKAVRAIEAQLGPALDFRPKPSRKV